MSTDVEYPKYPEISVQLIGKDGNAFNLLSLAKKALKKNGVSHDEIETFINQATSGDYDHLLQTIMKTVRVI